MSTLGWSGRTLRIAIGSMIIAAIRTKKVAYGSSPIDISDGEADGYRRLLEVSDGRTIEVSVQGVATSANWRMLRDIWEGNNLSDVRILHPDGAQQLADGAFLSGLSQSGEHKGYVAFSAQFSFSGLTTTMAGGGDGSGGNGDYPDDAPVQFLTSLVYPPAPDVPPPSYPKLRFIAAFSPPYFGWSDGAYGTLIEDMTPWNFTQVKVFAGYTDITIVSVDLWNDVNANGTDGRKFRFVHASFDISLPISSFNMATVSTFTLLSSGVDIAPGEEYSLGVVY